jgi:N6-adenosine-specific RNA methylase IME4
MEPQEIDIHPLSNLFPEMNPIEFRQLVEDIRINGQLEPVLLHPECKRIIDGKHRYAAVRELGIKLKYRVFDGNLDTMFQLVLSMNLKRRHLTPSQKAVLGLRVEEYESQKASIRRRSTQNNTTGAVLADNLPDKATLPSQVGQARDIAAKLVGVSARYIQDAKKIKDASPDLLEKVTRGEISLNRAILENKEMERTSLVSYLKREKPQTYNVILADPPWDYGKPNINTRSIGIQLDHYAPMSDSEISKIFQQTEIDISNNAVCLLWSTNPMLVNALKIMEEWGFSYKTNFCWVKDREYPTGLGYYFKSRHEILLLGVRGSFLPLTREIVPSFLMTEPREHSRKPDEIYDIIETLYPNCNYLELFARNSRDGWDCYGNETDKYQP